MRKTLAIIMMIAMVFCYMPLTGFADTEVSTTSVNTSGFIDMPNNWSTEALSKAVGNGLLEGFKEKSGTFIKPSDPLTRAQMATIVNRAFGAKGTANLTGVKDVPQKAWYTAEMQKAVKMGTMKLDSKMRPNDPITRQEAFTVLARAFKMADGTMANLEKFSDKEKVSSWAVSSLGALARVGYIQGADGKLNPLSKITRAEFAVVMDNMIKEYINKAGTVTQVHEGNLMINVPDVILKDITVKGDLILGDGIGEGNVTLENVIVKGNLIARGGGVNSIVINGGGVDGKVVIAKVDGQIRVFVNGAQVDVVVIDDGKDDIIVEGTVGTLEITAPDVPVVLNNASVRTIEVNTQGPANLQVGAGSTVANVVVSGNSSGTNLKVDGKVTNVETSAPGTNVQGTGQVSNVTAKEGANNTKVETPNTSISNQGAEGVTAGGGTSVPSGTTSTNSSDGTDSTVTPPSTGGGGSGSSTPVVNKRVAEVAAAKAAIEGATYTATQAEASDATDAATKAQALVDALDLAGTTAVVVPGDFTAAVAGDAGTPAGTNGSYKFTVTINKGSGTEVVSVEQTMTITATAYDSTAQDNLDIASAKGAIEGATYAATQAEAADATEAATKAQALVDALALVGTTAVVVPGDFTAAVAGDAGTPAGTNGSYTFTVTINKGAGTQAISDEQTMTITATAYDSTAQDNIDIGAAKGNIEAATYIATQVEAGDATAAATKAQALVDALDLVGTTAVVVPGDFTAATAGTVGDTDGTNGSYTFTVTINKGTGTEVATDAKVMTITATAFVPTPITAIAPITGEAKVGVELTAGDVTPAEAIWTSQWMVADTAEGPYADISGAIYDTYTPVEADAGKFIKVVATGFGAHSGTVTSAAIGPVAPADPDTKINIKAIVGVTAPVTGETPVTTITETDQYTGTVTWSDSPVTFAAETAYTATITLTAKAGYTLDGVAANFFTVAGATATNAADAGVVTAVFPKTAADDVAIATAAIAGVTAPVKGATPVDTIAATDEYTATISWSPADATFAADTAYTATITLTPKAGYTLTGVAANFFTVAGATATNAADSGVVTAIFPATAPDVEITAFDAIGDVDAGTAGSATYANAAAVQAALPTNATANSAAVTVPVTAWVDTDSYNPAVAGSYTFTATLGTIPEGFANSGGYTATVEVVVVEAAAMTGGTYYASIGAAITAAEDGGTIQIYAGTYAEQILIADKSLTIVGEEYAIIPGGLIASTTEADKSITISDLEFTTAGLEVNGYDSVTISDNTFTNITSWTEGQLAEGSADAIYVHGSETGTAMISGNTITGVHCNTTNVGDGMGITVLDLDNITITGNAISDTWHNSINIYQNVAGTVAITNNTLSNWDSNRDAADDATIGVGCEGGRALRIDLSAGATITVTGNTITPNDDTDRVDDEYVKITGVNTETVDSLIIQLRDDNTWTGDPVFADVILVNSTTIASYNGPVTGQITADGSGLVNGALNFKGTNDLVIVGQVTGTGNLTTFSGTVSGSINGTITAQINANGIDTLSGTITPSSGVVDGTIRIIGIFGQTGIDGDFEGEIITGPVPTYVETLEITSAAGSTVTVGDTLQLGINVTPEAASAEVAWSVYVNDREKGSIDENGLFTATAEGTVTVIAKALDGSLKDDTYVVTVQTLETEAIAAINAGEATLQDYENAGIIGLSAGNLTDVNTAVATAKATKGSDLIKEEIQGVVASVVDAADQLLLARVNASQLRITDANQAVDTIGDMLTGYFNLTAEGDRLTEIVSIFWFDNYHYQNKFTFASLDAVQTALNDAVAEHGKIIATFQGTEGYATNAEAVESFLSSALRLAKTSAGYNSETWLAQEINELADLKNYVEASDTGATIIDSLLGVVNGIEDDSSIDTLEQFFARVQAALVAP